MLTVACVLKSGGIYDATWVSRLAAGVARYLPMEYRFVCLSDVEVPCERIPLEHDWPGWWSKLELFKLVGPLLFFDLDTAIVGDLSEIAQCSWASTFVALRDFYRLGDGLGSGVMSWSPTLNNETVFDQFKINSGFWMHSIGCRGDQGFIEHIMPAPFVSRWQDIVPNQIVSYKRHCRHGIPLNARVVCLHGAPKFADMPVNDPVRQAWEMAA